MHYIIVCELSMCIFLDQYRCNVHRNKCYKFIMFWKPKHFIYTFFSNIISVKLNVYLFLNIRYETFTFYKFLYRRVDFFLIALFYMHVHKLYCFLNVQKVVFRPTREFSLICRHHHYRWRAASFDLYSAIIVIEQ